MNSFFWTLAAEALVFTSILFAIFWYLAKKINNYGIVDILWSYGFLAVVGFYVFLSNGWTVRKMLLLIMVGTWSLRLGTFLFWRITKAHPEEDSRYQNLRAIYTPAIASKFFWFFQFLKRTVRINPLYLFGFYEFPTVKPNKPKQNNNKRNDG